MSLFGCASDEQFLDENPYRESKCDYCNCALRDCSLCGSEEDGERFYADIGDDDDIF